MKILYGVQGTGNGHITRARAMANALQERDVDVQFLVSGRPKVKLFDMEPFGAFIDIGVHQDGLVHISAMSDKFIDDPRKVVKAGDIIKVKVMEVDIARKRIGLSMRMDDQPGQEPEKKAQQRTPRAGKPKNNQSGQNRKPQQSAPQNNVMAARLAEALNRK